MVYTRIIGSRQIGNYLEGHVPPNRNLFGGTVPPNRKLFGVTVPPNSLPLLGKELNISIIIFLFVSANNKSFIIVFLFIRN